jgi:hypothetical protein
MVRSASIPQGDFEGYIQTPRHNAAAGSYVDIAELLIEKGADNNTRAEVRYGRLRTRNGRSQVQLRSRYLFRKIVTVKSSFLSASIQFFNLCPVRCPIAAKRDFRYKLHILRLFITGNL